MSKKGQAQQIFIFILAIVIASMIFIYGYRAIVDFTTRSGEVALVNFQNEIQSNIKTIASDFGSVKKLQLSLPSDFQKVCFIDFEKPPGRGLCTPGQPDYNPLACDVWEESKTQNVFLVPQADITIKVAQLEIESPGYLCTDVLNGKIVLRLEGKGQKAVVSEWPI